jgi:hypothetical protein
MRKTWITLLASVAVHAAPLALVRLSAFAAPEPTPLADPLDRWAGSTADLQGERVIDVSGDAPVAPAPAEAVQVAPAAPAAPSPAPAEPVARPATSATPPPAPNATEPRAPVVAAARPPHVPPARRASSRALSRIAPPPGEAAPEAHPDEAGSGSTGRGGSFGAEGPGAPRDLGRAFTRAIPPACQADPVWSTLDVGVAGSLEVTITIDETGHLAGFTWPRERPAPPQLVALVKRTLALLDAGTFALRPGAVGAGSEALEIRATLSDGSAAEAGFASGLAFAYDHGKGTAGFTQSNGRHVEVSVTVVKVVEGSPPARAVH